MRTDLATWRVTPPSPKRPGLLARLLAWLFPYRPLTARQIGLASSVSRVTR